MKPRRPFVKTSTAACWAALALAASASHAALNPRDTSVQMFEWGWSDIATECTQWLGPQGYGGVQISPPHASKVASGWWGVYQPVNYVNLTSRMGTPSQLQTMIDTCHTAGVRVYADIVVNHLADGTGTATDGSTWNGDTLSYPFFSGFDIHSRCDIQSSDYNSPATRDRVMNCRMGGLPDLATENSYVQGQITNYLRKLLNMGVDGFRFDAAKHMPASALQSIMNAVKSTNPLTQQGESIWVTQEIIPDGGVTRSDYFSIGTVNEFQFTYAMRDVFRGNNGLTLSSIPSIMGTWGNWGGSWGFMQPQFATVFINNWDTEREDSLNTANHVAGKTNDTAGTKRFDLANIFMLAQGYGEAQVHSGFNFTNKDADRPTASPYVNGQPQINAAWDFVHRWTDISNVVKFRSAVSGQVQQNWQVGNNGNQVSFNRGNVGFVALNNSGSAWTKTFATTLPAGTYCNVVQGTLNADGSACTGASVTVDASGNAAITVAANNGGSTVPAVVIYTGQKVGGGGGGNCAVTFKIANANTTSGQKLYVVGNQPKLGNWTPANGFLLTIVGSGANATWKGTVDLPAKTAVQYKYVKWNGTTAVWETNQATASGNREFTTCAAGGTKTRGDGDFKF